jgi:phage terminase large subunit
MARIERRVIPYAPRRAFQPFHNRVERFAVGVAHRRCGKTVATVNDMIRRAICTDKDHYRAAYIAPYLRQAKDIAWEYLKRFSAPICGKVNESELWVELLNGARVRIYGADNAEALRGGYLDDATLDEYADMAPGVWGSIIRPMLADRKGTATFIGTPKGRNAFWEIYKRAEAEPDWFSFFLPASETGILPQSELAAARLDMTPEQFEQEFECSFEAAIIGAYFGKELAEAERGGRIADIVPVAGVPVHTAWDLGIGDSTAIWLWQAIGSEVRVLDHIENHGQGLPWYVAELEARGFDYGHDYVPHDARVRELGTGKTRVETLQALGRKPRLVPAHKIMDGINAARLMLPRVWFDGEKCKSGVEALRQYRAEFDEKLRAYKDAPRHDWTSHSADGFRYLAMAWREIAAEQPAKPLPPVKSLHGTTPETGYTVDEMWKFNRLGRKDGRV